MDIEGNPGDVLDGASEDVGGGDAEPAPNVGRPPWGYLLFDDFVPAGPSSLDQDRWRDVAPYAEAAFHVVAANPRHRKPRTRRERRRWRVRPPSIRQQA